MLTLPPRLLDNSTLASSLIIHFLDKSREGLAETDLYAKLGLITAEAKRVALAMLLGGQIVTIETRQGIRIYKLAL